MSQKTEQGPFFFAIELCLALFLSLYFAAATHRSPSYDGFGFDGRFYAAVSEEDSDPRFRYHAPWSYRILTPAIAGALPFETRTSFWIVSLSAQLLNLLLLGQILRLFSVSRGSILLGQLFYAGVFWTLRWSNYMPCYIDSSSTLISLLIIYLSLIKRFSLLPLVFALGALQKESVLLMLPFSVLAFAKEKDPKWKGKAQFFSLSILIPVLAVVGALRLGIPSDYGKYSPEAMLMHIVWTYLGDPGNYGAIVLSLFAGLGVLPLLALCFSSRIVQIMRAESAWLGLFACAVIAFFGGWDGGRLLLFALPALIILILRAAKEEASSLFLLLAALPSHYFIGRAFDFHLSPRYYKDIMWPLTTEKPELFIETLLPSLLCFLAMFVIYRVTFHGRSGQQLEP